MEKRAFLAVILMFLVLVGYEILLRPTRGPAPERAPADSLVAVPDQAVEEPPAASLEAASDEATVPSAIEVEVPERTIVVETDLVRAVLSNRGPAIQSWRLKDFEGQGSEWVELVPDEGSGGPLLIFGEEGRGEHRVFETDAERIVLDDSQPTGEIVFTSTAPGGRHVTETMRFANSSYLVGISVKVEDPAVERGDEIRLGWVSSLPAAEPNRKEEDRYFSSLALVDSEMLKGQLRNLKKEPSRLRRGNVHWAAVRTKYFATVLVPEPGTSTAVDLGGDLAAERLAFHLVLPARQDGGWNLQAQLYAGPMDYRILKGLGIGLEQVVDFGHKLIRPLSKLIYWMLVKTYAWIPNYGVVIIILSTLTKVLFYPLTQKSMRSMQSMQELQPKMAALKEKYKNDPKRMNQEVMKLYKEHGVNPLGGCLPLLLQSPVFFALYAVLQRTIELRRAPFVLWIDDLSRPDEIVSFSSSLPALSLLPILMGLSMFWQQRMSSSGGGGDPRQKMMGYMMPIFLTVIFFRMPSGLVLYWLVNTVLSIGQQYIMKRKDAAANVAEATG